MSNGITTVVSRITIPEKIVDVQERASETRQAALVTVSQQEAEKRVNTVQKAPKAYAVQAVKKETEEKKRDSDKDKKKKQSENAKTGRNLDLQA